MEKYNDLEFVRNIKKTSESNSIIDLMKNKETEELVIRKLILGVNNILYKTIFEREIRALRDLNYCGNIVKMYNYNGKKFRSAKTKDPVGIILMEYIDGKTLGQIDILSLSNKEKFKIIKELINGVEAAHSKGIIHRDLSPDNIMLDSNDDNKVKIIDFGICKIKDMLSRGTTYQFATNNYSAPETGTHNENATEKSDLYSIGAILYKLFTNEEPSETDFYNQVKDKTGIDIDLKKVIEKLVKLNPEERYNDIFDLKNDLDKIIMQSTLQDFQGVFYCEPNKFINLKKQHLITMNNSKDALEQVPLNFYDVYGYISDKQYVFVGSNYEMICTYDDIASIFIVDRYNRITPLQREKIKEKCISLSITIKFTDYQNANMISNNQSFEIKNILLNFDMEYKSQDNVSRLYKQDYGVWEQLLQFMKQDIKENAKKIYYKSYELKENLIHFKLEEDTYFDGIKFDIETSFLVEKKGERELQNPIVIGSYVSDIEKDGRVILTIKLEKNVKLNNSGYICLDYTKELSNIRRQLAALDAIEHSNYNCGFDLKRMITGIDTPGQERYTDKIKYFSERLDIHQQEAVRKALHSSNISIIQGPPGTGKTNVIIEIIQQILKENSSYPNLPPKKILIVSQSHPAVDKMISDLIEETHFFPNIIRLGSDEKVSNTIREACGLNKAKGMLVNEIKEKCQIEVNKLCNEIGIEPEDYERYYMIKELKDTKGTITSKDDREYIINIEKVLHDRKNIQKEKLLSIQHAWMENIETSAEIELYKVKTAEIIAGTCVGFISNRVVRDINFDYVIVDEAAKATFPELVISLNRANKIVLVGDHRQLPPVLDEEVIKRHEKELDTSKLSTGLFERIYNLFPQENKQTLRTQYRMHPVIGKMISTIFYDGNIQNGVSEKDRCLELPSYKNTAIEWISTSNYNDDIRHHKIRGKEKPSFINELECKIIKSKLRQLDNELNKRVKVGIITNYSAQKYRLTSLVKELTLNNLDIEINTVDAFQGSQKEIIIYSTVRSEKNVHKLGFLTSHERLNVAFSRATSLLIIVGDLDFLNHNEVKRNKFPEIINYIRNNEQCKINAILEDKEMKFWND